MTDKTTKQTRRESYENVLPKVKERARLVLETLGGRSMTVSEITEELVAAGRIPYFNRNYVAPRLTELKDMGIVETCGRRKATRSDATEAVWRRKEVPGES
ncbi:MAG: DNA gyrase [Oscillospiraceae bacterium]|nr:DNA gyrase [Oscillospiraceae bacterium]